jgi:hypothetical protein
MRNQLKNDGYDLAQCKNVSMNPFDLNQLMYIMAHPAVY